MTSDSVRTGQRTNTKLKPQQNQGGTHMKNTKLQNPSLRKRKGFTLIELIVVIAIIAILAAIAVPTFLNTLNRSKWNADVATARVIVSAYQVYIAEDGTALTGTDAALSGLDAAFLSYLGNIQDPQYTSGATEWYLTFSGNTITSVEDGTRAFYPATEFSTGTTTTTSGS